jgi:hypothetical protein
MGYHLVAEVLDHCPDLPYRQFRVLVALALDARDSTRRAMPGMEQITLQASCRSMRTAEHAVAMLRRRGLIKTVSPAAPGKRAVYEIPRSPRGNARNMRLRVNARNMRLRANRSGTPATSERTPATSEPDARNPILRTLSQNLSHIPFRLRRERLTPRRPRRPSSANGSTTAPSARPSPSSARSASTSPRCSATAPTPATSASAWPHGTRRDCTRLSCHRSSTR